MVDMINVIDVSFFSAKTELRQKQFTSRDHAPISLAALFRYLNRGAVSQHRCGGKSAFIRNMCEQNHHRKLLSGRRNNAAPYWCGGCWLVGF